MFNWPEAMMQYMQLLWCLIARCGYLNGKVPRLGGALTRQRKKGLACIVAGTATPSRVRIVGAS